MRHLDLFSGIGGFALAAQWVWGDKHEIVSFCEIDKFCQKVLKKNFGDVPIHDDIKTLKGDKFGTVDIISGGFPCQPFSCAGHKRGREDDRYLWPEMLRIIQEARPRWIIGENVAGIEYMDFDSMLAELETKGYAIEVFDIPACAVGMLHKRRRWWIVAYPKSLRLYTDSILSRANIKGDFWCTRKLSTLVSDKELWYSPKSSNNRTVDGLPETLDEHRLKSLGNAIVPQVAQVIMQAIKTIDAETRIQQETDKLALFAGIGAVKESL